MNPLLLVLAVLYLALSAGAAWGGVLLWRLWQLHRSSSLDRRLGARWAR